MPGLVHDHQYEADKAAICEAFPAEPVFDAIEWAMLRCDLSKLPVIAERGGRTIHSYSTMTTRSVPQIIVIVGAEEQGGETKIVLIAARIGTN